MSWQEHWHIQFEGNCYTECLHCPFTDSLIYDRQHAINVAFMRYGDRSYTLTSYGQEPFTHTIRVRISA